MTVLLSLSRPSGATLVEVLLAMVILALAMVPLAGVMHWGQSDTDYTAQYMGAMQGAQRILNTLIDNVKFSDIRASIEATGPGADGKWTIVNLGDLKMQDPVNPSVMVPVFNERVMVRQPNGEFREEPEFNYDSDPRGTWRYAQPGTRRFKVYYKLDFKKIDGKRFHYLRMPVQQGTGVVSSHPDINSYEVYITNMSTLNDFRSKGQGLYKITLWVTWDPGEQVSRQGEGVGIGRRDQSGALAARTYALVTFKSDLDM